MAQVETPDALRRIEAIARSAPRLVALAMGPEDFSFECGFQPTFENLFDPCQKLIMAARSAGIGAIGAPGSIAEIHDEDKFALTAKRAREMGFDRALCVHPKHVQLINQAFAVSEQELA